MVIIKDITTLNDIKLLVDSFYQSVREDLLIGPIFNAKLENRWPMHLEKMYTFWQTVLLGDHTYFGSPFPPHARLEVSQNHFDRWLNLWYGTIDKNFAGEKAEEAKWRGDKMAELFLAKITYYKDNSATPLL